MDSPFKKIGLAITFSPTGKALLKEASRLQKLFNAELVLIHVGEKKTETENKLKELINSVEINKQAVKVVWQQDEPAKSILKVSSSENLDLLIAGALEKETFIDYYAGSVARKIMRKAPCSVLIITKPNEPKPFLKKICVTVDFTSEGEFTVKTAYNFAKLENAEKLILIREFQVPGLAMTVQDSGSLSETEEIRKKWKLEEEAKLNMLVRELDLKNIDIETVTLYGKQGWMANQYVQKINGDILAVTAPKKRLKLMDRVFQHDLEFILKKLPCSLLIIKKKGK